MSFFYVEKSLFLKWTFVFEPKILIFFKSNNQRLLNCLRNISWKLEVSSLENLGEDIFLLIFKILDKINARKIAVHVFASETFKKMTISQKLIIILISVKRN